ncbi:MAG: hypothetical protein J6S75_05430, partial [Thermoguttaceae bacterium]|nr:hypothetical protein [Thermoguttaceae bacterium]
MSRQSDQPWSRFVWLWILIIPGLFFAVRFFSIGFTGNDDFLFPFKNIPIQDTTGFITPGLIDPEAVTRSRKIPQIIIRGNETAVLMTGVEEPAAKLYFIAKESSAWRLKQKIDLTGLLDGARCSFDNYEYEHRHKNDPIQTIGMNENWFAFGVSDSQDVEPSDICAIIIFRKKDGRWAYHSKIDSRGNLDSDLSDITRISHKLDRKFVLMEDDHLIVTYENFETDAANNAEDSPVYKTIIERDPALEKVLNSNKRGVALVYKLEESAKPKLIQTITPPNTPQYVKTGGMGLYSIAAGSYLFIHNYVPAPVACGCASDVVPWDDFAIYEKENNQWEYKTSLLSLFPSEILKNESIPHLLYRYINAVDDGDNLFIYYHQDFYPIRALKLAVKNHSIEFVSFQSSDTQYYHSQILQIPRQSVFDYKQFDAILGTPPSSDDECHLRGSQCFLATIEKDTKRLVGTTLRLKEGHGDINFDDKRFHPLIRYSYSGNRLITSYYYDGLYFEGNTPLARASKAWSGVDIYEIDPKTGPQRVFRMTTSHGR